MNRRDLVKGWLAALAASRAGRASVDPLSWQVVMAREWKRPAQLDAFRGVRPRLYVKRDSLEALRRKIAGPRRQAWKIVRENADRYLGRMPPDDYNSQSHMREAGRGIPWQALAYVVSGEAAYLDGARKWMLTICGYPRWERNNSLSGGECLFGVSVGYDWLYGHLDDSERRFVREKLVLQAEALKNGPPVHHDRWLANHNHVEHLGLAAAGFALFDEVPEAVRWIRQADLVFRVMLDLAAGDGSSTEGHQYWGYTAESVLRYAELARDLLGEDYYHHEWLKGVPDFVIHSTLPDFSAENCVMSFGDSGRSYASHGPTHILYRLGAEYRNAQAQWLALEMQRRQVGRADFSTWANLLWYDETLSPVPLSQLPTFWHCEDIGWITSRSGWDADAVMTGFKCGPMHGHKAQRYYDANFGASHEIGGGHGHPDVNSFQVYAYGKWLAIDPGYERPKRTDTHNTILIDGKGQLGEGSTWFERKAVMEARASSAILKAEHTPTCDYVVGDAKNIYPAASGLAKFHRHFVYLRPDLIVVADDLEADRQVSWEWLLHTEVGFEKRGDRQFTAINGDVAMDIEFLLPARLEVGAEGRTLKAAVRKQRRCLVVVLLHPRRAAGAPTSAELKAQSGGRVELTIRSAIQQAQMSINLKERRVVSVPRDPR